MKLLAGLGPLLLFACSGFAQNPSGPDLQAIDKSVDPCESLYRYACGNYVKTHPIPADESSWGRFNELQDRNLGTLRNILEESSRNLKASAIDQKIGGFYESCMNEGAIEERGTAPLQPELERIDKLSNASELVAEVARLHEQQVSAFFGFGSFPDPKNARMNIGNIDREGWGFRSVTSTFEPIRRVRKSGRSTFSTSPRCLSWLGSARQMHRKRPPL
ncbi:MAG: endothelin-converting enzyme [Bryobacterales bacterium]|nr:endothelin-converting enzyme [Bryobacterales bacterium]